MLEILSTLFILLGFELFNRRHIKAFTIMAIGQFLAMMICAMASLWFLAFMHLVNFLMQIRGWYKWQQQRA
ncbi:MAG: nicotinamide mononucleotide transporter [Saprospiraceae bacterium]|nr:nicotinamide mononucleotide transporter [Saprospiraceae bacterium]